LYLMQRLRRRMSRKYQPIINHYGHASLPRYGAKCSATVIKRHDDKHRKQRCAMAIQPARPIKLEKRIK
jgi:hypothetical protein